MWTLILLTLGIILILVNYRALKKEGKVSFNDTFNMASQKVTDYDLELMQLRKEFAETILEFQQEIESLKDKFEKREDTLSEEEIHDVDGGVINQIDYNKQIEEAELEVSYEDEDNSGILLQSNNTKVKEIGKLLEEGLSIDLISEKLGIGKGEVLLIQKLYVK